MSITITATGTPSCPVAVVAADDCQFMYWLDSGTVKGTRLDGDGNALSSEFTASGIGTVDDGGLSGDSGPGSGNSRKIRLCAIESGVPIVYSSTDGEAFS